jgi:hypothetical protein
VRSHFTIKSPSRQKGLALLILVIVILLAVATYLLSDLSITQIKVERTKKTYMALKKAKQAVIGYAVTYVDKDLNNEGKYGVLPCPETFFNGNDGNMAGSCNAQNLNDVEWLPWRSLDLPTLKDESGTCLFYAVSGTYKNGGSQADMINEDSIGMFQIVDSAGSILQGANIEDQVVALVIAPGGSLTGQARNPTVDLSSCGQDYANVSAYLEGNGVTDNSTVSAALDTIDQYIHATETSADEATPYNDKFLTITRDEIWDAIVKRSDFKQKMENLTQAMALCMATYANLLNNTSRRLPWPVFTNLGATTDYRDEVNYEDDNLASQGYSGRYPYEVTDSNNAIDAALSDDNLFDILGCSALPLIWGPDAGIVVVDLQDDTTEYRKLWNNWKDHFFYVLSKGYEPDNTGAEKCNTAPFSVPNPENCIKVNGAKYAAAVIFSGSRLDGITRNDKSVVSDYLEDNKDTSFTNEAFNKTGIEDYTYTAPQTDTENDVMFCIQDDPVLGNDLSVIECI